MSLIRRALILTLTLMATLTLAPAALAAAGGKAGFPGAAPSMVAGGGASVSGEVAARGGTARPLAFSGFDLWALGGVGLLCGLGWLALATVGTKPGRATSASRQPAPARTAEVVGT